MVTKFSTSQTPSPAPASPPPAIPEGAEGTPDNMDKLAYILLGAIGIYVVYKFIVKPELDRIKVLEEAEEEPSKDK